MNEKNTKKLLNDFPEFFKNRDNIRASLMGFGFDCSDGWFNLIYNLCKDIKEYYENNESNILDEDWNVIGTKKGVPEYFYVTQVKEKFGGLRFYITAAPKEVHDMINKAEDESYKICEICGKPGEAGWHLPWYLTLCDKHLEEKEKNLWGKILTVKERKEMRKR